MFAVSDVSEFMDILSGKKSRNWTKIKRAVLLVILLLSTAAMVLFGYEKLFQASLDQGLSEPAKPLEKIFE